LKDRGREEEEEEEEEEKEKEGEEGWTCELYKGKNGKKQQHALSEIEKKR
jgi:hypothetical protein